MTSTAASHWSTTTSRSPGRCAAAIGAVLVCVLLAGCAGSDVVAPLGRAPPRHASTGQAPLAPSAGAHVVQSGETVYAIAWRHGLDYRDLARWNAVPEPFTIFPGQTLRLTRPAVSTAPIARAPQTGAPHVQAAPRPPATTAPRVASSPPRARAAPQARGAQAVDDRVIDSWQWPARGSIVGDFAKQGGKGIDIAGARGSPVVAAAPGYVVYSGSGLRGYGKLIIVKHNKRYLSAYAHNDHLHAKEGDTVESGQLIADMGNTDSRVVKLHFEIRRDGQPVDPARYLPR